MLQPGGVRQTSAEERTLSQAARVKRCSQEGCANGAVKGGVCITHGVRVKRCGQEGCAN